MLVISPGNVKALDALATINVITHQPAGTSFQQALSHQVHSLPGNLGVSLPVLKNWEAQDVSACTGFRL